MCLQHLIELTISVKPIQLQLSLQRNADHSGWLCKDKGETLLSAVQQFLANPDRRFFILRGYFLAYFKSDKVIALLLHKLTLIENRKAFESNAYQYVLLCKADTWQYDHRHHCPWSIQ